MKTKFYALFAILLTMLTTGWIFHIGTVHESNAPVIVESEAASYVDDVTLDTFIRVYATKILDERYYELTSQNRENIRNLLSSMGKTNILKLKQDMSKGTHEEILNAVKNFSQNNFLWEEETLLKQYINTD